MAETYHRAEASHERGRCRGNRTMARISGAWQSIVSGVPCRRLARAAADE